MERERIQNLAPAKDIKSYGGTYINSLYGEAKISQEGEALVLYYRGRRVPLKHWNGDVFSYRGPDLSDKYSSYDDSYIDFGFSGEQADRCYIHKFDEGEDAIFYRK